MPVLVYEVAVSRIRRATSIIRKIRRLGLGVGRFKGMGGCLDRVISSSSSNNVLPSTSYKQRLQD